MKGLGMEYASGSVTITVDYGYDIHQITFSGRTFQRVQAGKVLTIKGQGFRWDATPDQDYWQFNKSKEGEEEQGALYIFTAGAGEIFIGRMDDGRVWVDEKAGGSAKNKL